MQDERLTKAEWHNAPKLQCSHCKLSSQPTKAKDPQDHRTLGATARPALSLLSCQNDAQH